MVHDPYINIGFPEASASVGDVLPIREVEYETYLLRKANL